MPFAGFRLDDFRIWFKSVRLCEQWLYVPISPRARAIPQLQLDGHAPLKYYGHRLRPTRSLPWFGCAVLQED